MHKKALILICLATFIFGQASLSDLRNLSNIELDRIKSELMNNRKNETPQSSVEDFILPAPNAITLQNTNNQTSDYFGYDYFNQEISFFDNTPVPSNYKLGPGDEIILSMWGETNQRKSLTIDKNGQIYFEDIGFVNISNMILSEAEKYLTEELSTIYATLKDQDGSTRLSLSLGNLKSINVYFSGQIENPGISLVHPFSDIFSAIIQGGGIKAEGSLREVQLIRSNNIVATVDFYSFFMNGKSDFLNIKIVDGDVIHIPKVGNRVQIEGEVAREGFYEIFENESISDLINYANGLTPRASSFALLDITIPAEKRSSDDEALYSANIKFKEFGNTLLSNGAKVKILPIHNERNKIEVLGRVKNPGLYSANNSSLKTILDLAGGFNDPIFSQTIFKDQITILRRDSSKFYSQQFSISYKESASFMLQENDKVLVYSDINYLVDSTYRLEGEFNKPGTYPLNSQSLTVREAIDLAGGLTPLSSFRNLTIMQEYTDVKADGTIITTSAQVNNANLDFIIGNNSVIKASPTENVVNILGNVYNPGLVSYQKGLSVRGYIELAGGMKKDTLRRKIHIKRANGAIEKYNIAFAGMIGNRIYPGDTIVVPLNESPSDFNFTSFIADLSSTLANLAAILIIVDNNKN